MSSGGRLIVFASERAQIRVWIEAARSDADRLLLFSFLSRGGQKINPARPPRRVAPRVSSIFMHELDNFRSANATGPKRAAKNKAKD